MADKKPPVKQDFFVDIMFWLLVFFVVSAIITSIAHFFGEASPTSLFARVGGSFFRNVWPLYKIFAFLVTAAAVLGIQYAYRMLKALNIEEKKIFRAEMVPLPDDHEYVEKKNEKWESVITNLNSPNPANWRLAIIEADVMLEDLLRAAGYHGESLGEMLKSVEVSDFLTIDYAWAAHKVRNQIAHADSDFLLNEREAKETIAHYEAVFKEFKII